MVALRDSFLIRKPVIRLKPNWSFRHHPECHLDCRNSVILIDALDKSFFITDAFAVMTQTLHSSFSYRLRFVVRGNQGYVVSFDFLPESLGYVIPHEQVYPKWKIADLCSLPASGKYHHVEVGTPPCRESHSGTVYPDAGIGKMLFKQREKNAALLRRDVDRFYRFHVSPLIVS